MNKLYYDNSPLLGKIRIPGDKSISHRSVMLASLAEGESHITNFLSGEDCMRTIEIFRAMGVKIEQSGSNVTIEGKGVHQLAEPAVPLYFGNSGTTARLMLGILAGLPFFTTVYGDSSLTRRPMNRVIHPLKKMGASIDGAKQASYLPLAIRGRDLQAMTYELPVRSAQVKSALLLAGLFANGDTTIMEMAPTRNHTENMLRAMGVPIEVQDEKCITMTSGHTLRGKDIEVPGDISSAAFFLVAAAITPGSHIELINVGLNETRTGLLQVLQEMGADLKISNVHASGGEMIGDIEISYHELKAVDIGGSLIPKLIDELPVIALLATQAEGVTTIYDAEELKVKETDRIKAVYETLSELGADIRPTDDGLIIRGKTTLQGGSTKSYHDHRIAMMTAIASIIASDEVQIDDLSCVAISYPEFFSHLDKLLGIQLSE
ncbi:3-phosphoshikimate 1-carboxyvinyltransferase [Virgibacillus halophilus]|uniref:3-phosphoshikimate 1-carboxyvinyltransferase n=1 Tax=Tigheibacillus halophilus TaxID=361280 RepID=UPI00363C6102